MIALTKIQCFVYRAPIKTPVQTSFGIMRDRPMVLVRVEDEDGTVGWGEVWCNFPSVGAEHRARMVDSVIAPLLLGQSFATPNAAFDHLTARTEVLAIQAGEYGAIAQAISGIDIALWDLVARKEGKPLWQVLGGDQASIPVYASGLNPKDPEILAAKSFEQGYRGFKLKIGFGEDIDHTNLKALRRTLGSDVQLMVDANQGWVLDQAIKQTKALAPYDLTWLEEPLRADRPLSEWQQLSKASSIPLAGGENMVGDRMFDAAMTSGAYAFLQPDVAKWGGISKCLAIARRTLKAGLTYCPHYLGGGIGLVASAHCLAAAGGDGMLEIDANPNPLRDLLAGSLTNIQNGTSTLTMEPGLGIDPAQIEIDQYSISY
jgi:L-alanine-DL-glutamate epimerase-like enolase superfamily enzyme